MAADVQWRTEMGEQSETSILLRAKRASSDAEIEVRWSGHVARRARRRQQRDRSSSVMAAGFQLCNIPEVGGNVVKMRHCMPPVYTQRTRRASVSFGGLCVWTRYACKAASLRLGRGSLRKLCTVAVAALETSSDLDLEGKAVVVAGLGVSGRAAAELALDRGATVTVVDDNAQLNASSWLAKIDSAHLKIKLGACQPSTLETAQILVLSPGIPLDSSIVQQALECGVPITSELGFAYGAIPTEELLLVAVTGTNGKSTVTHFTTMLLNQLGISAWGGGNLGIPLSALALEMRRGCAIGLQVAVVEVSSYQLEVPSSFRPNVAVLLNLSPDHLERHGSMEAYAAAKCSLFRNMRPTDVAMIPAGDIELTQMTQEMNPGLNFLALGGLPGVKLTGRQATVQLSEASDLVLDMHSLKCRGTHNMVNAGVAAALVAALRFPGVDENALQSGLSSLTGLPHRMQVVGELGGIEWINDSKATNIDAAATGIGGLEKPAVVLLGGVAKRAPNGSLGFWRLAEPLTCHRAVVAFGRDGPEIAEELLSVGVTSTVAQSLKEAVVEASQLALPGDAVLLSPGCASFDEFISFENRGEAFVELMQEEFNKSQY
ncbi:UDP-N-acetylmuramoylalanine--D-glutamate ligase-like [Convolutriloba macropyga]|uniref:UDP-N-acetylmuramoylalanine--D-glutamate ligase-like n=1 Tax=Convolutriloba macropyga TaxID=536237 RepID=UPI003F524157